MASSRKLPFSLSQRQMRAKQSMYNERVNGLRTPPSLVRPRVERNSSSFIERSAGTTVSIASRIVVASAQAGKSSISLSSASNDRNVTVGNMPRGSLSCSTVRCSVERQKLPREGSHKLTKAAADSIARARKTDASIEGASPPCFASSSFGSIYVLKQQHLIWWALMLLFGDRNNDSVFF